MKEMGTLLAPRQLEYGVRWGVEAAVHATRLFLHSLDPTTTLLKLDFKNAFSSIHSDKMLEAVWRLAPSLFSLVCSAYASSSTLFWKDTTIESSEDVQQGDLLGSLRFCLTIHSLCSKLSSALTLSLQLLCHYNSFLLVCHMVNRVTAGAQIQLEDCDASVCSEECPASLVKKAEKKDSVEDEMLKCIKDIRQK